MTKMRRFYTNELFHEFLFFSLALICMLIFAFIQPFGEGRMKSTASGLSVSSMRMAGSPKAMIRRCSFRATAVHMPFSQCLPTYWMDTCCALSVYLRNALTCCLLQPV